MPMMLGGAVVVIVVLVLVMRGGGTDTANAGQAPAKTAAPAAAPTPVVATAEKVQIGAAKAGKTPDRPAPTLSEATLQELNQLLTSIKTLRNESVTARTGQGDNQGARAKMVEAKKLCDQWIEKVRSQLEWQELAQMDNWAQPAEYIALEKLYATFQRLENEVRKGGGGG